ncbi:hypothetical protein A3B18_00220 [Candidatus Giovannonibacteria bacterium RIFCSPLOWO2_01_FULL_46_13]|uniref:GATA-type domain-containing protein n=1 Tax=Candidatus Giovannonibacteria bacterium RIFCSPLOWO2_01_FULL_46_13 TaxID=1798352 RepID=A0A1F5X4M0_9BACT|nr:MAG: hypothetical protein A3B18_00220 [Candidatus Giovannonibacteria bacterium RIFCSPLOWO2_01_FULL_46_13]
MQLDDGRDGNFVCFCGGDLHHTRTLENGRKVFKCNKGGEDHQELLECVICGLPKTIWADDGTICGGCGMKFLSGELELTEEQKAGIMKWSVATRV